jgi:hypothetical protein
LVFERRQNVIRYRKPKTTTTKKTKSTYHRNKTNKYKDTLIETSACIDTVERGEKNTVKGWKIVRGV